MCNTSLVHSVCCCDILQYSWCLLAWLRPLQNSNTMVRDCISEIINHIYNWLLMSHNNNHLEGNLWVSSLQICSPMTKCSQQSIHLHGQYFNETLSALLFLFIIVILGDHGGDYYLLCNEWKYLLATNYCTCRETVGQ